MNWWLNPIYLNKIDYNIGDDPLIRIYENRMRTVISAIEKLTNDKTGKIWSELV